MAISKTVNIQCSGLPITALEVPIRGTTEGIVLTTDQIFKVMCQKGIIDEVLDNGQLKRLDLSNYKTDHNAELQSAKEDQIAAEAAKQIEIQKQQAEARQAEATRHSEEVAKQAAKQAEAQAQIEADNQARIENAKNKQPQNKQR